MEKWARTSDPRLPGASPPRRTSGLALMEDGGGSFQEEGHAWHSGCAQTRSSNSALRASKATHRCGQSSLEALMCPGKKVARAPLSSGGPCLTGLGQDSGLKGQEVIASVPLRLLWAHARFCPVKSHRAVGAASRVCSAADLAPENAQASRRPWLLRSPGVNHSLPLLLLQSKAGLVWLKPVPGSLCSPPCPCPSALGMAGNSSEWLGPVPLEVKPLPGAEH